MKKFILIFGIFTFATTLVVAQNAKKADFTFCNGGSESISLNDLKNCTNLQTSLEGVKIKSFTLSLFINGAYADYPCLGNRLTTVAIERLKVYAANAKPDSKIMITQIVCIEGNKEVKHLDITLTVK